MTQSDRRYSKYVHVSNETVNPNVYCRHAPKMGWVWRVLGYCIKCTQIQVGHNSVEMYSDKVKCYSILMGVWGFMLSVWNVPWWYSDTSGTISSHQALLPNLTSNSTCQILHIVHTTDYHLKYTVLFLCLVSAVNLKKCKIRLIENTFQISILWDG